MSCVRMLRFTTLSVTSLRYSAKRWLSTAPSRSDLGSHFVNGQFLRSGQSFEILNPTNGALAAKVYSAGKDEVAKAIQAARLAQAEWAETPAAQKSAVLLKWASLIKEHWEELAKIDAEVMGKPVKLWFDGQVANGNIEYIASLAVNNHGHSSMNTPGIMALTMRQPFGITGGIIPWNVPLIMVSMKVAPAVAAGNSIIVKTSEKAPLTPAFVISLTKEAGFPDGLIQCLHGKGGTGAMLAEHMDIRKISFTGSTSTGKKILAAAANSNMKACTIEAGGKGPAVVFEDADLDQAISAITFGIACNSGQICMANSRIYVHEKIYDHFCDQFKQAFAAYKQGDPTKPDTMLGPQADTHQADIVRKFLKVGKTDGRVLLGGKADNGNFVEPTIFTDVDDASQINKDEIFGPVTVVHKFSDESDLLKRVNDTETGLYGSIFTKNIDRALRVAKRMQTGTVAINTASPNLAPDMPFGGVKQSGIGCEMGPKILDHWTEEKAILIKTEGF